MHINRFRKTVLLAALFSPTIILILNQLVFDGNKDDVIWDYLGAIGWAIFMLCLIMLLNIKSNNIKYTIMNKWTRKVSASFLNRHYSNDNERIIPMKGGNPIRVAPKGMFLVGLITDYDELVFVDIRPKHISISISAIDNIATGDGVKIDGIVEITIKVFEDDKFLMRLISKEEKEEGEEKTLYSNLKASLKKILSEKKWIDITILKSNEYEDIKQRLLKDVNEVDRCFKINEVTLVNLSPIDKEFADSLEKDRKEEELEKLKVKKIKGANERIVLERKEEKERMQHEIELDKKRHEAEMKKKKDEHKAGLSERKDEIKLDGEILKNQVAILKKDFQSLVILNPSLYEKLKLQELKSAYDITFADRKHIEQKELKVLDNKHAQVQGQVQGLLARAQNQFELMQPASEEEINRLKGEVSKLTEEVRNLRTAKSTNETEDSKNESEAKG